MCHYLYILLQLLTKVFVIYRLSGYFTATMINSSTVNYDSHQIIQDPGTGMGRNLLEVQV